MPQNRAILLDWLQFECQRYQFRRETYYLCQSYIDSFLKQREVTTDHLKLLGVTCLQIAMKVEEVDIKDVKTSLDLPEKSQVGDMEWKVVT